MPLEPVYALGGQLVARRGVGPVDDTFILGVTEPVADYALTPAAMIGPRVREEDLEVINGNITNTSGITEIKRKRITGYVKPSTPDVKFVDCIMEIGVPPGSSPTSQNLVYPGWDGRGASATNQLYEFCEIRPTFNSHEIYGFKGGNAVLRRSVIRGVVDGCQPHGSGTYPSNTLKSFELLGCLVEDLRVFADPNQSDNITHNDGVQATGAITTLRIQGSSIKGGRTSCILIQQRTGQYQIVEILENWLYGHTTLGSTINTSQNGLGPIASDHFWVMNNRMSKAGHAPRFPISPSTSAAPGWVWSGNTYMEDGTTANFTTGSD